MKSHICLLKRFHLSTILTRQPNLEKPKSKSTFLTRDVYDNLIAKLRGIFCLIVEVSIIVIGFHIVYQSRTYCNKLLDNNTIRVCSKWIKRILQTFFPFLFH